MVMTELHSCANCHSFSRDGKTLGLDMDGPQNDKGLYALVPIAQQMTMRTQDMISWASFSGESGSAAACGIHVAGFARRQIRDDHHQAAGNEEPGSSITCRISRTTDSCRSSIPTRGILAWYDRETKTVATAAGSRRSGLCAGERRLEPRRKVPGVCARGGERSTTPRTGRWPQYANDPAEMQIQYDLYRIPFNDGQRRHAGADCGRIAEWNEQQLPKGLAGRQVDCFCAGAATGS